MKEIVERLQENRNIERAKSILESNGYKVSKKSKRLKESVSNPILEELESCEDCWTLEGYQEMMYFDEEGGSAEYEGVVNAITKYLGKPASEIRVASTQGDFDTSDLASDAIDQVEETEHLYSCELNYYGGDCDFNYVVGTLDGIKVVIGDESDVGDGSDSIICW